MALKKKIQTEEIKTIPPENILELRKLLLERKTRVHEQQISTLSHLDEQVLENRETPSSRGDEADASVNDTSADYFYLLSTNQQNELNQIESALDRMNRGIYGICENCEESISLERLKSLPYARFCVDCQAERERKKLSVSPKT